jgi:hypothetical protein
VLCGCDGLTTRARDDRRAPPPHQETWAWARESSQSAVLGPRCRLGRLRRCAPASRNAWTVMRRELETWRPEICVRRIITKAVAAQGDDAHNLRMPGQSMYPISLWHGMRMMRMQQKFLKTTRNGLLPFW